MGEEGAVAFSLQVARFTPLRGCGESTWGARRHLSKRKALVGAAPPCQAPQPLEFPRRAKEEAEGVWRPEMQNCSG